MREARANGTVPDSNKDDENNCQDAVMFFYDTWCKMSYPKDEIAIIGLRLPGYTPHAVILTWSPKLRYWIYVEPQVDYGIGESPLGRDQWVYFPDYDPYVEVLDRDYFMYSANNWVGQRLMEQIEKQHREGR